MQVIALVPGQNKYFTLEILLQSTQLALAFTESAIQRHKTKQIKAKCLIFPHHL